MNKQAYKDLTTFITTGEIDIHSPIFKLGFGSLKALLLNPGEVADWPEYLRKFAPEVEAFYNALIDYRSDKEIKLITQSLKASMLSSFFTPKEVIQPLLSALSIYRSTHILEPSAGTGNFIEYLPTATIKQITAIEKEYLSHEFLSKRYPEINTVHGGFETFNPIEKFDLVLSNIPFGDFKVFDQDFYASRNKVKIQSTTRIHNYFFVKALDCITAGGKIAFIVSSNFLDTPSNKEIRAYINEHTNLISAIRLPNHVFSSTGTKPTCDIIILEKKTKPKKEDQFVSTQTIQLGTNTYYLNTHYINNSDCLLGDLEESGQYRNELSLTSSSDLNTLSQEIEKLLIHHVQQGLKGSFAHSKTVKKDDLKIRPKLELTPYFSIGNLYVQDGRTYRVDQDDSGYFLNPSFKINAEHANALIQLRKRYLQLLDLEEKQSSNEALEFARQRLNEEYDVLRWRFGPLNGRYNAKILQSEIDAHILKGLENHVSGQYEKAEIFKHSVNAPKEVIDAPKSLSDAIIHSLNNYNTINSNYITKILSISYDELVLTAVKEDLLYLQQNGNNWELVTKSEFASGNIQLKVDSLANFPTRYSDLHDVHKELLIDHLPEWIPFELLDINLGERWIPIEIWKDFVTDFFCTEEHQVTVQLIYTKTTDKYSINIQGYSPIEFTDFAVRRKTSGHTLYGSKIVEHAFADTSPTIKYTVIRDGKEMQVVDHEATRQAQEKIEEVSRNFQTWIRTQLEHKKTIENEYNKRFNSITSRQYDGSHLELTNLESFTPYPSQKNAVYRNLCKQGGVNDHIVGAGKSLVMAITCHEMKRLRIINKPMIVCLKANVTSVYKEYIKAYPNDKVLHPEDKHFKPANRAILFQQMMNNRWDAIIISHDQFKMIPQSTEIEIDILQDELTNIEQDLNVLNKETNSILTTRLAKGLEKRKQNVTAKIQELRCFPRDSNLPDFKKIGIDHLFVDESHIFKNLMYTTRHRQVSGLGNPQGSQRAYNMLIACRTLQALHKADRGVTFLSGTTISNSLVELYLIFKYLCPTKLQELDINSFDAWAKVYAIKSGEFEFSVTNEVKRKERYREFIKVPELAKFYTEISDVVNEKNFKIEKPQLKNELVNIPPTTDQQEYMKSLVQFAKTKNPSHIDMSMSSDELKAYMLICTNQAKKMSLDMRIIDPIKYSYDPGCKAAIASKVISEVYLETNEHLGTQLVFCDLSTPSKTFNVYDELRRLLTEHHDIPNEEIAYIHNAKTKKAKQELFEKVNKGIIRVLIGSTTKMGVGVNVQQRVVAMHHLDCTWTPSGLDQRNGRGGRPGNIIAKYYGNTVRNFIYAVERSLDSYQFNLLQNKSKFISQIKDGSIKVRRIDEGSMGGEAGEQQMNFTEYVALLSGNQSLLEIAKLDKKIRDIEILYAAHVSDQSNARMSNGFCEDEIEREQEHLTRYEEDNTGFQELQDATPDPIDKPEKRFYYPKPVIIDDKHYYDTEIIGQKLKHIIQKFKKNAITYQNIATYGPFGLQLNHRHQLLLVGKMKYVIRDFEESKDVHAGKRIQERLEMITKTIEATKENIASSEFRIEQNNRILSQSFDRLDELQSLKDEKIRLVRQMEDVEEAQILEETKNDQVIEKSSNKAAPHSPELTKVLNQCTVIDNVIKLPHHQLDRSLYLEVKKTIQQIGGTYKSGKNQGFEFDHDPSSLLQRLQNGETINIKQQFQFFPTPQELADRMTKILDIKPEDSILEPSAGQGALVDAIHRLSPSKKVACFELLDTNRTHLQKNPNIQILGNDFLDNDHSDKYDKIIANPPFSKNQDIRHVYQMFNQLKKGGRIVVITSTHWTFAQGDLEEGFRNFVDKYSSYKEKLPEGTFKDSGTQVKTMLLVLDKPTE